MIDLVVTIKGTEGTYRHKFLIEHEFRMSKSDPTIRDCVREAMDQTKFNPEDDLDIKYKASGIFQ